MSSYFGLHEVYEFLRKVGARLILPKLIALAVSVLRNLPPVGIWLNFADQSSCTDCDFVRSDQNEGKVREKELEMG